MIKRLLVLVMFVTMGFGAQGQADSLGVEKKGEQLLVIHKVKSGQTLYALARRYGTSVKKIREANPVLEQGLKVGQTLKVPYDKPIVVPMATTAAKTHTVSTGETLYAISRKYGLTVDELKKLNNLTSNALARGQKLVVEEATVVEAPAVLTTPDPKPEEQPADTTLRIVMQDPFEKDTTEANNSLPQDTTEQETSNNGFEEPTDTTQVQKSPEPVKYNGTPFKEVKEEGVAELIEEEEPTNKFLALHKTARVGTVIKIRNLKNDLAVYVRVVGNIPDTADNDNILIKINKRAHDQLKAFDPRLRVELSYFQ